MFPHVLPRVDRLADFQDQLRSPEVPSQRVAGELADQMKIANVEAVAIIAMPRSSQVGGIGYQALLCLEEGNDVDQLGAVGRQIVEMIQEGL